MDRRDFLKTAGAAAAAASVPFTPIAARAGDSLSESELMAKVNETLAQMTLDEKLRQMSGSLVLNLINAATPGRQRYTGYTPANDRLGIPALQCLDGPRGVGLFYKTTAFPVGLARGATWDPEIEERVGEVMGYETRALSGNQLLAPCINVIRHPSWGRSQESYGEDPVHLGVLGAAHVRGTQKHVMACAKHYAVNNIDESRMFVNAIVDERTLREIYLPHFKDCVDADVSSIMSAYNDVNGELAGHNEHLIRDILKGDWGFKGFVISDWINAVEDEAEAANAGLDVEMPRPEFYDWKLKKAVKDGRVSMEVIDDAVSRILREKFRFPVDASGYDEGKIASGEHTRVALEAQKKAMVLLKNEDAILPLDKSRVKKLALVGEFSDKPTIGDVGSSNVTPPYVVTALQGIGELLGGSAEILHVKGNNASAAAGAAAKADVTVVVAGLDYRDEGEGNDREDLNLSDPQEALIEAVAKASDNVVVVLEGGGAITMERWKDKVKGILMAWYPGMEGGHAIAETLFGDSVPGGKLPVVFPKSVDQLFEFDNKAKEVEIGYYHGYRFFEKNNIEPAFPFGFGLSYTTFKLGNLRLSSNSMGKSGSLTASIDVTNTGAVAGDEVVQLYVGYNGSSVDRPVKDLKGFKRVTVAPGRTETVSVELAAADLAYYDVSRGEWVVEAIGYTLYMGNSSSEADLLSEGFSVA